MKVALERRHFEIFPALRFGAQDVEWLNSADLSNPRTCDPCVPNVSGKRKVQQKQQNLPAIDHLYRPLFMGFLSVRCEHRSQGHQNSILRLGDTEVQMVHRRPPARWRQSPAYGC
jgi:hypothetical protein